MTNISKKIMRELFVSALVYLMIAWMAVIFVLLTIAEAGDIGEAFMWIIVIGIGGCWGDECVLLFPFAPFLIVFAVAFFIVRYSRLTEYFIDDTKKFFKRYVIAFLIIGIPIWFILIVGTVASIVSGGIYNKEVRYYWNKYGTEETVSLPYKFIYSNNDSVLLKDANRLYELSPLPVFSSGKTQYISPKGNFFIRDQYLGSGYKDEIIEVTHTHTVASDRYKHIKTRIRI